jgi:hypothetical protein
VSELVNGSATKNLIAKRSGWDAIVTNIMNRFNVAYVSSYWIWLSWCGFNLGEPTIIRVAEGARAFGGSGFVSHRALAEGTAWRSVCRTLHKCVI